MLLNHVESGRGRAGHAHDCESHDQGGYPVTHSVFLFSYIRSNDFEQSFLLAERLLSQDVEVRVTRMAHQLLPALSGAAGLRQCSELGAIRLRCLHESQLVENRLV